MHAFLVDVHDQVPTQLLADEVLAKGDHLPELPGGIHMHQGKRGLGRVKGLLGKPHHDRGILADRVKHDRIFEFGGDLANYVDTFGFEFLEVGKIVRRHVGPKRGAVAWLAAEGGSG